MGRKVKEQDVVEVALDEGKNVTTVKLQGLYYPLVLTENRIYISNEGFASALTASNHGRKVRREKVKLDDIEIKKENNEPKSEKKPKTPKVTKVQNVRLWKEFEMRTRPDLAFQEIWVITNGMGEFAHSYLNGESKSTEGIIKYAPKPDFAQHFPVYEEAQSVQKILNQTVKIGHKLRRFYLPTGTV